MAVPLHEVTLMKLLVIKIMRPLSNLTCGQTELLAKRELLNLRLVKEGSTSLNALKRSKIKCNSQTGEFNTVAF